MAMTVRQGVLFTGEDEDSNYVVLDTNDEAEAEKVLRQYFIDQDIAYDPKVEDSGTSMGIEIDDLMSQLSVRDVNILNP